jgi:hypothetical protein
MKHAGFKPISHTSSALKKFFPADDDDMEPAVDDQQTLPTSTQPFEPRSERPPTFSSDSAQADLNQRGSGPKHSPSQPLEHLSQSPAPTNKPHPALEAKVPPTDSPAMRNVPEQDNMHIPSTPSISSGGELYSIISQVGEGTFGKVYKAQNTVTKLYVALKRIRMESEKDGFPVTAMREIKLLQSLSHPNVVRLYEMMVSNGSFQSYHSHHPLFNNI